MNCTRSQNGDAASKCVYASANRFLKSMLINRRQFARYSTCRLLLRVHSQSLSFYLQYPDFNGTQYRRVTPFSELALRFGLSIATIKSSNQLRSDRLQIGQKLKILQTGSPSASSQIHTVARGDTLSEIANTYGISTDSLKKYNQLRHDRILIGQKLRIPKLAPVAQIDWLTHIQSASKKISIRTHNWTTIVVHHSAIKYGNAKIYDQAHRQRGMKNGLAYHFIIGNGIDSGNGQIEMGPRWMKQQHGGHVRSYQVNKEAIGICLVGNFEQSTPSQKQMQAFTQLTDWLTQEVLPQRIRFAGHKDIEKNLCPGKYFPLAQMHRRYG
jgi:LysM repeat protein